HAGWPAIAGDDTLADGLALSTSCAAACPLRTAPSIVAGQPVSVHEPARINPGTWVRGCGLRALAPGAARKVAECSRVTKNRSTWASLAPGRRSASAGRYRARRSSTGAERSSSAADSDTARYCPVFRRALSV